MKTRDCQLGMNADISRRDLLNGVSVTIGTSMLWAPTVAQQVGEQDLAGITVNRWPHGYAFANGGTDAAGRGANDQTGMK